jgi:2-C-methyl-D-erythritol 4-phosphate cytidylyltransferase
MSRRFAIVPAGGSGSRFGTHSPKQFTLLRGQPLLAHAIAALLVPGAVEHVFVALSPEHQQARTSINWALWGTWVTPLWCAGETRAITVQNALQALQGQLNADDWVLVHDGARPCLSPSALERLIATVGEDAVGGLLALPVADTLKREDGAGRVQRTVDRAGLWSAQTPQMFRYGLLRQALRANPLATDEASAVEALGHGPLLVMGETSNLKITTPADLELAEHIVAARKQA